MSVYGGIILANASISADHMACAMHQLGRSVVPQLHQKLLQIWVLCLFASLNEFLPYA